jgi:hypothetical protein
MRRTAVNNQQFPMVQVMVAQASSFYNFRDGYDWIGRGFDKLLLVRKGNSMFLTPGATRGAQRGRTPVTIQKRREALASGFTAVVDATNCWRGAAAAWLCS